MVFKICSIEPEFCSAQDRQTHTHMDGQIRILVSTQSRLWQTITPANYYAVKKKLKNSVLWLPVASHWRGNKPNVLHVF